MSHILKKDMEGNIIKETISSEGVTREQLVAQKAAYDARVAMFQQMADQCQADIDAYDLLASE